jgi:hypothetical protein
MIDTNRDSIIEIQLSGKLTTENYRQFVPDMERHIGQEGKVRLLVEMHDFHGWDPGALWEDIKFDFKHFNDIERIAFVGEKKWQELMSSFCKPFTGAKVKFFHPGESAKAYEWLAEDLHKS